MYSKNDYRYYLENQTVYSDGYLIHERSHKYIKKIGDRYFYTQQEIDAYNKQKKPDNKIDGNYNGFGDSPYDRSLRARRTANDDNFRGVRLTRQIKSRESIKADQARGKKRTEQLSDGSGEYKAERAYNSKQNNRPKSSNVTVNHFDTKEEAQQYIDSQRKRKPKSMKSRVSSIRKKYGLYREKPKGKKLKGGGNIYVSHS